MGETPQKVVEQAYDSIAGWYLAWVEGQNSPRESYTEKVLQNVAATTSPSTGSKPRILELGAGAGVPITRMLLDRGAEVVANDISTEQLKLAAARCPEATLVAGDMLALDFAPASFDGVVGFYSIFHLPRAEQKTMLAKIHAWLKPGGHARVQPRDHGRGGDPRRVHGPRHVLEQLRGRGQRGDGERGRVRSGRRGGAGGRGRKACGG
ncbi:hypothetical protein PG987_006100 [Apiospora arundinis]